MYEELKSKDVRCRKPHRCEWCDERINAGEPAHYRAYKFEGDFMYGHSHPECWEAMGELLSSPYWNAEDTWTPGDWLRGSTEPP